MTPGHSMPLARAVAEIERHVADGGWDQPARLYALAPTDDLVTLEPGLADRLGVDADAPPADSLTPVEQELPAQALEDVLATIVWPGTVVGCALALERIVLPPTAEDGMPDDAAAAARWAASHPDRADVRIVVGVLRDGARSSLLRVRGHEDDRDLVRDPELAPELAEALAATFAA
ncbi:MAG TPA: PPA1309 family protein [Jiangellaceae bacterium]|nr:PPA1309 family protein [Jiangellaceae bacterium]